MRRSPLTSGTSFIFLTARGEKQDLQQGMNSGAGDYLIKPVAADDFLAAIDARLDRETKRACGFTPDFGSAVPFQDLALTPREAKVPLWVAQGKSNPEMRPLSGRRRTQSACIFRTSSKNSVRTVAMWRD